MDKNVLRLIFFVAVSAAAVSGNPSVLTSHDKITLTFKAGKVGPSRPIEIRLLRDGAPKATENFKLFCERKEKGYVGTKFHRVVPGFVVQGGGIDGKSAINEDGSHFGKEFPELQFPGAGWLSFAKTNVPVSMAEQFFFTTGCEDRYGSLNDGFTVFGKVVKGMDVVKEIECIQDESKARGKCTHSVVYQIASCSHVFETVHNVTVEDTLGLACSNGKDRVTKNYCDQLRQNNDNLCIGRRDADCFTRMDLKEECECNRKIGQQPAQCRPQQQRRPQQRRQRQPQRRRQQPRQRYRRRRR
uniref:Peptidyl-prolyl cis-trans isomerase n=1 Tax=Ciona intestinalis TaxID=7719 RepID=F6VYM6_CIOIN|nr:peptidyl-prolyl cis-trans isomerase 6-like [Ciona intestinalis]|eukprot:XP_002125671.1 peptidyl-prolyl cis-trans isomerase 6-like [Ciona intestinalis]